MTFLDTVVRVEHEPSGGQGSVALEVHIKRYLGFLFGGLSCFLKEGCVLVMFTLVGETCQPHVDA